MSDDTVDSIGCLLVPVFVVISGMMAAGTAKLLFPAPDDHPILARIVIGAAFTIALLGVSLSWTLFAYYVLRKRA